MRTMPGLMQSEGFQRSPHRSHKRQRPQVVRQEMPTVQKRKKELAERSLRHQRETASRCKPSTKTKRLHIHPPRWAASSRHLCSPPLRKRSPPKVDQSRSRMRLERRERSEEHTSELQS